MHRDCRFMEPGYRRRPRGGYFGRGGVKFAILELLKEKPRHGYDIIREIEERSGGAYSPSPGVIYPTLQALEDQDYAISSEQEGKRVYSITDSGLAFLDGHKERMRERRESSREGADRGAWRESGATDEESGLDWQRQGHRGRGAGAGGSGFGTWLLPNEMPELMKELRWFFGDFAGAMQRTITDPEKIKEILQVLREAKHKIDQIVLR
jgi:DNA-binding PadR family transcriptional regulator